MRKTDRFGITIVVALAALSMLAPRGARAQDTVIEIGDASGPANGAALVAVGLMTGTAVAGTENEIATTAEVQVAFNDVGEPDCIVDPSIGKDGFFAFQPTGCTPGDDCSSIKAIIIGIFESTQEECDADPANCYNLDPIPDGSTLYTCNLELGNADGTVPLVCANPDSSDPDGVPLPTTCTDGEVTIVPDGNACVGDCNGNGVVTLGEVQTALDIFFDEDLIDECRAADANGNGSVTLGEVQASLDNFFDDCPE